ncbi:MAG: hypothetical protein GC165_09920 [Armatimonadetes bacterium]|nr:hypothetical protein [Armatimonadota bacterium]
MKNKAIGLFLAMLACVPIFVFRAVGNALLTDSDTAVLLKKITEVNNPWRWFTHDWPLENHFYRPISTLVFEIDNRLHPGNGDAFGLTNAIICAICTVLLYWLLIELKRSIPVAVAGTWLFASWSLGNWFFGDWWLTVVSWIPVILFLVILGRMRSNKKFSWQGLAVGLAGFFVWSRLASWQLNLSSHTLLWLPGRTATTMTIFALVSLASYARFERLGAPYRTPPQPTPLDPPATRTSTQDGEPRNVWGWFILSCVSCALALMTYEQAVMIPTVIFMLGIWFRLNGRQTRFAFQILFWGLVVAYCVYRVQIIPVQPSGYQKQQFRNGPGLWIDTSNYLCPGIFAIMAAIYSLASGPLILLTSSFWGPIIGFISNITAWLAIRKRFLKPLVALLASYFAYLPMVFLKQFGHYHYFPATLMVLFVITLFEAYWPELVTAVSPRAIQAPPRSDRAPGSLPRL